MVESDKEQSKTTWPLVKFQFSVKIGDKEAMFQEVTGLSAEVQQIEYRAGNSNVFSAVKMPGLKKNGNIILKKGIFKDDKAFWNIFNRIKMNTIERQTISISLLDENGEAAMSWTLLNAFISKITGADLKSNVNETAVESMELTHEGLTMG